MVVAKECGALLTLNHSLAILPLMFSLCFRVGLDENEDGIVIPGLTGARDSLTVDMEVRSSKEKGEETGGSTAYFIEVATI